MFTLQGIRIPNSLHGTTTNSEIDDCFTEPVRRLKCEKHRSDSDKKGNQDKVG